MIKDKKIIILLFVFFLGRIFLGYLFQESFFERGNRSSGIDEIAVQIIDNGTFGFSENNPTAVNEPIYTSFVALSYFIFGRNWIGVAVLQSLMIFVLSIFIYRLTDELWKNKTASLLSLILVNIYPFYVSQSISISDTVTFTTLLGISIYYSYRSAAHFETRDFLLSGLFWGLTLLTRLSGIAIMAGVLLYFFIMYRPGMIKKSAVMVAVSFLVIVPWLTRNYIHTSKIFISTHGAIELWMGHNETTRDVLSNDVSVDIMRRYTDTIPSYSTVQRNDFPTDIEFELAQSEVFIGEVKERILSDPFSVIESAPLKFVKFWSIFKNPETNSLDSNRSRLSKSWDLFYTIYYTPILILALIGFFLKRKDFRNHSILILIFISYSALHMLVFGFTRLRVPIDQFLIIYASLPVSLIYNIVKDRFYD